MSQASQARARALFDQALLARKTTYQQAKDRADAHFSAWVAAHPDLPETAYVVPDAVAREFERAYRAYILA